MTERCLDRVRSQAVTDTMSFPIMEQEVALGQSRKAPILLAVHLLSSLCAVIFSAVVDAALEANVKLFIFSSLVSVTKVSDGRYTRASPFDAKADITNYLKASGLPHSLVSAGGYLSNLFSGPMAPIKQADGSYLLNGPFAPASLFPLVDIPNDFGAAVRALLENPACGPGSEILTGVNASWTEIAQTLSLGKSLWVALDRSLPII